MSYENIKFDGNLTKNKACKITYSGHLFQNGSEFVNIVYGFGNEWHHTKEQDMEKTDEGFVVNVNMLDFDTFNFCFRNSNYEWDNNNYQNYTSPIVDAIEEEIVEDVNFILNDDSVITNIMNNLCEIDVSTINNQTFESISVEEITEPITMAESAPFEIEIETNTPVDIEDSLVNVTEAENLDRDIESLFTDIYQEATAESQAQESLDNGFDMNNLIDEILSPVVKSDIFEDETTLVENISEEVHSNFFEDLDDLDEDETLDNKIDSLITSLFNNTRAFAESKKAEQENISNIDLEVDKAIDQRIDEILSETPVIVEEITTVEEPQENIQETVSQIVQEVTTKRVPDFTIIEDEEESLIETLEDTNIEESNSETALIEVNTENGFTVSPRALRKFYMFKKKVKLAFSKLFVTIPKMFSKGFNTDNN